MALTYFDPDGVHDLRVEIKQLRSFFRLIEWITPAFAAKKSIRNIRMLFKSAETLRDVHVQQMLTREWTKELGVFLSEYYNSLKQKELPARDQFAAFANNFDLQHEIVVNKKRISRAVEKLSDDGAAAQTWARVGQLLRQIIAHGNENRLQEEHLHQVRILAKETRYTVQVAQCCFPGLGYSDELDKRLRGLHQVLGKWHDTEIALEHVDDFLTVFQGQSVNPSDDMSLTGMNVYEKLCQKLQKKKAAFLGRFEERWDESMPFLDKQRSSSYTRLGRL